MSRVSRAGLIALGVLLLAAVLVGAIYLLCRPSAPAGGPVIGLSMASKWVIQRPLYEDALARAGGKTILITPTQDPARLRETLDQVDALLLTGGDDVDPHLYGGHVEDAASTDRRRDEFEIELINAAIEMEMPVLGICRGVQILNVAHGGTIRNLRDDSQLSDHHGIDFDSFTAHQVTIMPQSRLADALGPGEHQVNSFHGQAVDQPGDGLQVAATADDGIIEAVERPDRPFVIGIQWHPEIASLADEQSLKIFRALVHQADEFRRQRKINADQAAASE